MNFKSKEKGSALIFSLLIMGVVLVITLSLIAVFTPKIRIITESVNSQSAAYSADSALEWCLYVYRKRPPSPSTLTMSNGATNSIYQGNSNTLATCLEPGALNYRAVGVFRGVSRSFLIGQI